MVVKQHFTVSGSIVRITMQNFMTYKHETFWPGKILNLLDIFSNLKLIQDQISMLLWVRMVLENRLS